MSEQQPQAYRPLLHRLFEASVTPGDLFDEASQELQHLLIENGQLREALDRAKAEIRRRTRG
jgi:hypothetical protein